VLDVYFENVKAEQATRTRTCPDPLRNSEAGTDESGAWSATVT
jgi:hypothetical protein